MIDAVGNVPSKVSRKEGVVVLPLLHERPKGIDSSLRALTGESSKSLGGGSPATGYLVWGDPRGSQQELVCAKKIISSIVLGLLGLFPKAVFV